MRFSELGALAISLACSAVALGDEVIFTNGDKLTGTIVSADGGKLIIKSDIAGEVTVDMAKVKTFSTTEPLDLVVGEKNVLKTKVAAGADGQVQAAGGGGIAAQPVNIKDITKINPPPVKWTGSVKAMGMIARGNTYSDNLGIAIDAMRRTEQDRITGEARYLYGQTKDQSTGDKTTNTDNWFAFGKYDYFFNKKLYAFGAARIEKDRVAGIDFRFTPSAGVGYQWVEKPDFNFSTEAGIAWVYEELDDGTENDYVAVRLAYHLDKKLNDSVKAFHNLEFVPGLEDGEFTVVADAGIRADITKELFTEFKVEWKHDSEPAEGSLKNDVRYLMSVGWTF